MLTLSNYFTFVVSNFRFAFSNPTPKLGNLNSLVFFSVHRTKSQATKIQGISPIPRPRERARGRGRRGGGRRGRGEGGGNGANHSISSLSSDWWRCTEEEEDEEGGLRKSVHRANYIDIAVVVVVNRRGSRCRCYCRCCCCCCCCCCFSVHKNKNSNWPKFKASLASLQSLPSLHFTQVHLTKLLSCSPLFFFLCNFSFKPTRSSFVFSAQ